MRANDILNREEIRGLMQKAIREGDTEGFYQAFDQMLECIQTDIQQKYDQRIGEMQQEMDSRILAARGVRQLTKEERDYYQRLGEAMKSADPRQAVTGLDAALPWTKSTRLGGRLISRRPGIS